MESSGCIDLIAHSKVNRPMGSESASPNALHPTLVESAKERISGPSARSGYLFRVARVGRLCPLPIPATVVDGEDVERQVTGRNTT